MYEQGLGVAKDDAEAVRWFRKAAEQGNTVGQKNLEDVYRRGGRGLGKSEADLGRAEWRAMQQTLAILG